MKKLFFTSILIFFILLKIPTSFAQEQVLPQESNLGLLATVSLSGASLVQVGHSAEVSFSVSNRSGVQSGIKYAAVLASETEAEEYIVDEVVYDEVITLGDKETVIRRVVYTAPTTLSGTYALYILSKNEAGLPFGMVRAGTLELASGTSGLVLDTASCYLTISGKVDSPRYSVMQQAVITATEQLQSHCVLQNTSDSSLEVTPIFNTRLNSIFGATAEAEGGDTELIMISAKEKREIITILPRGVKSQIYAVTLSYGQDSNEVTYNYSVGENFGLIMNAYSDKTQYGVGETAKLSVTWKAEGANLSTLKLKAAIYDEIDTLCGQVTQEVLPGKIPLTVLDVPITKACSKPSIALLLTDTTFGILDTKSFGEKEVAILEAEPEPDIAVPVAEPESTTPLTVSLIALLLILVIVGYMVYGKRKRSTTVPLAILFAVIILGSIGVNSTEAATFTQNSGACNVSISYSPVSNIRTGDTITVNGYTSCPGLQVDAVFLAAGSGFSVTANAFGGFFGSFTAPPQDDVIQYVSGDWTCCVFNLGNPTPPVDYIFVNYCPAGYLNYCELPPYPTIFGEKVGWSGGACSVGSTGSCNYTCQSDLTWRQNSNSCSVPPPPPPSASPQFTSVPTCTISANATSCTGLVSVTVPPTYTFGADLKLCDGTYLQTIPPGNASVSVTIPYNTACFNLHPWSFLATPSTDTVIGAATCTAGTNWNGSACALLPSPTTPTGLGATPDALCGTKAINVVWDSVIGATSYDLERDGVLVNNVVSPHTHLVLVDGSSHNYRVRAVNGTGSSAWSAIVPGTAPASCVLPTPIASLMTSSAVVTVGTQTFTLTAASANSASCQVQKITNGGAWSVWNNIGASDVWSGLVENTLGYVEYKMFCYSGAGNTGTQSAPFVLRIDVVSSLTQCSDGIDNDGDGSTDYPNDPGCADANDTDETNGIPPPTSPSGFIAANPCVIAAGNATCNTNVAWSSTNFSGAPEILQGATPFSADPSSLGWLVTVSPVNNTFTLRDSGGTFTTSASATVTCDTNSTWVPSLALCAPRPVITITANPNVIRSGNTAPLSISIDALYDLTCTFRDGGAVQTFNHTGAAIPQTYNRTTRPLTSAQVVRVDCASVLFPAVTGFGEVRINVVPTIQEI